MQQVPRLRRRRGKYATAVSSLMREPRRQGCARRGSQPSRRHAWRSDDARGHVCRGDCYGVKKRVIAEDAPPVLGIRPARHGELAHERPFLAMKERVDVGGVAPTVAPPRPRARGTRRASRRQATATRGTPGVSAPRPPSPPQIVRRTFSLRAPPRVVVLVRIGQRTAMAHRQSSRERWRARYGLQQAVVGVCELQAHRATEHASRDKSSSHRSR